MLLCRDCETVPEYHWNKLGTVSQSQYILPQCKQISVLRLKQSWPWNNLGKLVHAEDWENETVRHVKQSRYSWLSGGYVFPAEVKHENGILVHAEDGDHETVRHVKQSRYSCLSGGYVVVMLSSSGETRKFDFLRQIWPWRSVNCPSQTIGILTKLFCTFGPSLNGWWNVVRTSSSGVNFDFFKSNLTLRVIVDHSTKQ